MNPFTTPDRLFISRRPQDMRAGVQRLASVVVADFGEDPQDGALYCFVSRDCEKMKMLRFDVNGWCLYYCRLAEGCSGGSTAPIVSSKPSRYRQSGNDGISNKPYLVPTF